MFAGAVTVVPGAVVTVLQFVTATVLVAAVGVAYVALAAKKRERVAADAAESTGAVALKYTEVAEIVVVAIVATWSLHHFSNEFVPCVIGLAAESVPEEAVSTEAYASEVTTVVVPVGPAPLVSAILKVGAAMRVSFVNKKRPHCGPRTRTQEKGTPRTTSPFAGLVS